MMLTDKERCEQRTQMLMVANHLQTRAESAYMEHDDVCMTPREVLALADDIERWTSLIDRPTCHDVGGGYEFRCSGCGCVIHIYRDDGFGEDDSAMTVGGDSLYVPRYCPNCGAEVAE